MADLEHGTLVFDLDGTLVRLTVDWGRVADAVAGTLEERGVAPPENLWAMLETAETAGHREAVEAVIGEFERDGARNSERLPAAETVPSGRVGVCSLNCEEACHIALETHAIDGVGAVVGRDTVTTEKPDPEPLLETVERLGGEPSGTLFVGDSERDERTAERAGTEYAYVSEWLRAYA